MPSTPQPPPLQRRDSWPPTQIHLQPSIEKAEPTQDDTSMPEAGDSLPYIDDSPLTYFLTPAPPLLQDTDSDSSDYEPSSSAMTMDLDFAFDAGIEDRNHPPEIIRSVSPSSLVGGLARPPTPPRSVSPTTTDEDEDEDEFIHFGTGRLHQDVPFSLRDFAALKAKRRGKAATAAAQEGGLLMPAAAARSRPGVVRFASSPGAGRAVGRPTRGRTRSVPARRGAHVWREPSPDVWAIEEETEEELEGVAGGDGDGDKRVESKAAKPKKRVRFVLPAGEA